MKHGRTALWIILICLMLIGLPTAFADGGGNYTDAFGKEDLYAAGEYSVLKNH